MTLHQLMIFEAVAARQSITEAATEIRVSQPSISKQLRLLEEEYDVKFHARTSRGIRLTEEGRLFQKAVQPILRQVENLKLNFKPRENGSGTLVLAATESPSASFVPELLKTFSRIYPDAQPIVRTGNSHAAERMLLQSEAEIAIVTYPSYDPRTVVEMFRSSQAVAFVSAKSRWARKRKLAPAELAKAPFIIKMAGRTESLLKQKGLNLRVIIRCESGEAVKASVEAGLGIGILYRDHVEHNLKHGNLKRIEIPWLKDIDVKWFIVRRNEEILSKYAQEFMRLLWQKSIRTAEPPNRHLGSGACYPIEHRSGT